jgi:leucyl aminopeptidase (aminopeptidase T)
MKETLMARGAKTLVEVLAEVKRGENVLILCDFNTADVGKALVSQVYQIDASPFLVIIPPLKIHGEPLPDAVTEMAKQVNVLIAPMTTNIAHTAARHEAQKSGVRVMVLPEADERLLASEALQVDFYEWRPRIEKMAQLFTKAKMARVTTAKGTDISIGLEGRKGRALHGFTQADEIASPPCLESSIAPVEGTSEGAIVVDVSIPGLGLVTEPVEISVHNGFATEIRGGAEAGRFKDLLESKNDPNIYNIAELGVGMNPNCRAEGSMLLDEGVLGTIHIALGTSAYIGGKVKASGHYDVIVSKPTLELDGVAVVKDGELNF